MPDAPPNSLTDPHTHTHTQFPPLLLSHTYKRARPPHPHPSPPTAINPNVISSNSPCSPRPSIDLVLIVPLLLLPPPTHSWSSRLVMSPISQRGSTAPSRTTWRRKGVSRADTSSACLPPPVTSSRSPGTKVRAGGGGGLAGGVVGGWITSCSFFFPAIKHVFCSFSFCSFGAVFACTPPASSSFASEWWRCEARLEPELNVNLRRRFALPVYIQNTLSQPITMAPSHSKSPTGVYIHLPKIDLFLNPNYHALCTSVSFILAVSSPCGCLWLRS